MKKTGGMTSVEGDASIDAYSKTQPAAFRAICDELRKRITAALPAATCKVWHGSPVWFIDGNPVVGYNSTAKDVHLLFWNGLAFDEPDLKPVGRYGAAQALFGDVKEVKSKAVSRWLAKASTNVFDSKAFFKKLRAAKS